MDTIKAIWQNGWDTRNRKGSGRGCQKVTLRNIFPYRESDAICVTGLGDGSSSIFFWQPRLYQQILDLSLSKSQSNIVF